ncbi:MAG: Tripartite ATP-independent periplasmic transporter, DctQ component [Thermotoga petrophila]|uniref:Tripartite ATP-independent periplasmic transporter, DctQ component n=1 Tax=Thermotoga petrophila TaxID=93929 RepID=A0A101EQL6_9THEM|nr:MAG: Tripartite ATP-independent periplasmic transporter, DctQ component [Thermotoga petrophila]
MAKLDQVLFRFEKVATKVLIVVMTLLIFISGVARFLGRPMNLAVNMSTFFFGWACFFAIDIAWRENKLMCVDVFVKRFPESVQRKIRLLNYFIICAFLIYVIIWGIYLTYTTRFRTYAGIHGFSYSWINVSVPIGAALALRTTILKIIYELKGGQPTCYSS